MRPEAWPLRSPLKVPFRLNRDSQQAKGLVFWAPLNNGRAFDWVSGNVLTKIGTTTAFAGPIQDRLCWNINGANGDGLYLNSTVVTATPVTMVAWVYCTSDTGNQVVMSIGDTAADTDWFALRYTGNVAGDPVRAGTSAAGTENLAATTVPYPINTWSHATAVFSSPTARESYLNADAATRGANVTSRTPAGLDRIGIGFRATLSGGNNLVGYIADVRIYNRILSRAEIWTLWDPNTRYELYEPLTRIFTVGKPCTPVTFYPVNLYAGTSNFLSMQSNGSAPTFLRLDTGWNVGTITPTLYSNMASKTMRATTDHTATVQPSSAPDNTLGDCFRSEAFFNGTFDAGSWLFSIQVKGGLRISSTTDGRLRVRVYTSQHADGTLATQETGATQITTGYTNLRNDVEQTLTVTITLGLMTLVDRYIYFQIAHELQGAGDNANCDVRLCVGSSSWIKTPCYTGTMTYLTALPLSRTQSIVPAGSATGRGNVSLAKTIFILQAGQALNSKGAVTLSKSLAITPSASAIAGASLLLNRILAIAESGRATNTKGTLSLSRTLTTGQSAVASARAALSLSRAMALTAAGPATGRGSLTLSNTRAITQSGQATGRENVTLSTVRTITQSALRTTAGILTLAKTLAIAESGRALNTKGSLTLSRTQGITESGRALNAKGNLSLTRSMTLSTVGRAVNAKGAVTLANSRIITTSGRAVNTKGSLTLSTVRTITVNALRTTSAALALARTEGLTTSGRALNTKGSLTLARSEAITAQARLNFQVALTLARSDGLTTSGAATGYGALTLSETLAITDSGQSTNTNGSVSLSNTRTLTTEAIRITFGAIDVAVVLSMSEGIAVSAQASSKGSISLARSDAITTSGRAINAKGSVSLSKLLALLESGRSTNTKASINLGASRAITEAGRATNAKGSISLSILKAITEGGRATALGTLLFNTIRTIQTSGVTAAHAATDVAITLSLTEGLTVSAHANAKATVALIRSNAISQAGSAQARAQLILSEHLALSLSARTQALAAVSLNLIRLINASGRVTARGSISAHITLGMTTSARAMVTGQVNLSRHELLSLLAEAAAEADVGLLKILTIKTNGIFFVIGITPPERIYCVPPEDLVTLVPSDEQVSATPDEIRIYIVDGEIRVFDVGTEREMDPSCLPILLDEVGVEIEERIYFVEGTYREFIVVEDERDLEASTAPVGADCK